VFSAQASGDVRERARVVHRPQSQIPGVSHTMTCLDPVECSAKESYDQLSGRRNSKGRRASNSSPTERQSDLAIGRRIRWRPRRRLVGFNQVPLANSYNSFIDTPTARTRASPA